MTQRIIKALRYLLFSNLLKLAALIAKTNHEKTFLHSYKGLRYVSREKEILSLSKNKKILHFGFLDYPFMEERISNNSLLHTKIKEVGLEVIGVDIEENYLNQYKKLTNDSNNMLWDIEGEVGIPEEWKNNFNLIIFGEILEHLKNPQIALKKLKQIGEFSGATIIITVPNVFAPLGIIEAVANKELIHPDHYYYFSPFTLKKLLESAGFNEIEILLTGNNISRLFPGILKPGIMAIAK